MRLFSSHAPGNAIFVVGGMWVARLHTTSWPATASFTADGSKMSTCAGVAPSDLSSAAFSSLRATALTSWPAATSSRTARFPNTPVAPATKIFIVLPPGASWRP